MIILKSPAEIEKMRRAGQLVAKVLRAVREKVAVGVTTLELDTMAEKIIRDAGGVPAFKGYLPHFIESGPFPATLCTSVNSEVVHGIPGERPLQEGDLLSIDTGALLDGYYGDAAISVSVGKERPGARKLMEVTEHALEAGIVMCQPGNRMGDLSNAIQSVVEAEGFSVVRSFVGHGIGKEMHEDPPVPNYGARGKGVVLKAGMVLAIEPMVNEGGYEVAASPDSWPVKTKDGSLSAHFEHTVAITENGPDVLTRFVG